jgi:hypothetical protein
MQGNPSGRRSAVRSGVLTGLSTAAVSGSAAVAGAILSRKFGHGGRTDGFFAAYAVYVAVVLVASALRVVVLPPFARARTGGRLGREVGSWALALAVPLVPVVAVVLAAPDAIAGVLTHGSVARASAAELLPWLIPASVAQVYAGVTASALAALDDYGTAALGFAAGAVAGLGVIAGLVHRGVEAFGWGLAVNGAVSLGIPLAVLVVRGGLGAPDLSGIARRLWGLVEGVSLPFALQGLYVIALVFAGGLGSGKPTTFSYAYLIASLLVSVTATSIALISSVPLSRGDLTPERTSRHVVSASWVCLALVAGAAGFFSLAGERVGRIALGSHYGGGTGEELGRLVAYLGPWMVASVALSVAFPLIFVQRRARWLPLVAVGALAAQVLVAWAGRSTLELAGIAAAMALTTAAILTALLILLRALPATAHGVLVAAAATCLPALLLFGVPRIVLGPLAAAFVGLGLYVAALALWRPQGLVSAWGYLRQLHA